MAFQTFTPIQYLMIDIANSFGLDKENWDVRLSWFQENEHQLDAMQKKAEAPALFFAGVQAYRKALAGQATSYPISLDATASGAQILACVVGCEQSAMLCNVLDAGKRQDFYSEVHKGINSRLDEGIEITRKQAKEAVMPALYGSKREPEAVFGLDTPMLSAFYQTMEEDAPGVWQMTQDLIDLWDGNAASHDWILPDNFHVKALVMDKVEEEFTFLNETHKVYHEVNRPVFRGVSIAANATHSIDGMLVREMLRRCTFDPDMMINLYEAITAPEVGSRTDRPKDKLVQILWANYEASGFLSARILENLDIENMALVNSDVILELMMSMPDKPFPVLTTHDCFRVHPNYGNDVRRQYTRLLFELARADVLGFIAKQIGGPRISGMVKFGDIADRVLEANYALS